MKSKTTNRIVAVILVIAFFAIAAAGYFAYTFFAPMKTTVYVFNDNYKAGTTVSKDMLSPMQVDAEIVIAAKHGDVSMQYVTVNGLTTVLQSADTLLVDVTAGTTLMPWLLTANGGGAVENNLDENHVAVTVPMDSYSGVTDDLRVGSRVNIYSTSSYDEIRTYLLLSDMIIIDVKRNVEGALTGITFSCTDKEALTLLHAKNYESIYCGLISNSAGSKVAETDKKDAEIKNEAPVSQSQSENTETNGMKVNNPLSSSIPVSEAASTPTPVPAPTTDTSTATSVPKE